MGPKCPDHKKLFKCAHETYWDKWYINHFIRLINLQRSTVSSPEVHITLNVPFGMLHMRIKMHQKWVKLPPTTTKRKCIYFVFNFRSLPKSTLAHGGVSAFLELLMFSELCPKDDSIGLEPKWNKFLFKFPSKVKHAFLSLQRQHLVLIFIV